MGNKLSNPCTWNQDTAGSRENIEREQSGMRAAASSRESRGEPSTGAASSRESRGELSTDTDLPDGKHVNDEHLQSKASTKNENYEQRILKINYKYLQDNLEPRSLVGYFIQEDIITLDESDEIMETQPKTRFTRATKFIHMIIQRCPSSYGVLRSALLKEDLSYIAKELDETVVTQQRKFNTGMEKAIYDDERRGNDSTIIKREKSYTYKKESTQAVAVVKARIRYRRPDESPDHEDGKTNIEHTGGSGEDGKTNIEHTGGSGEDGTTDIAHTGGSGEDGTTGIAHTGGSGEDGTTDIAHTGGSGEDGTTDIAHTGGSDQLLQFSRQAGDTVNISGERNSIIKQQRAITLKLNPDITNISKDTPIHMTCQKGHIDTAKILLDQLADISARGQDGRTSLHNASESGYTDTVRFLLDCGADIAAVHDDRYTALHFASQKGHTDTVTLLLTRGAIHDVKDRWGSTPLHWACQYGHKATVKMLLDQGADIGARGFGGRIPLHYASESGCTDTVIYLLEHGADIAAVEDDLYTALNFASQNGHTDIAKLLLTRGANHDAKDKWGNTPLHLTCRSGHIETVQMLLDKGADIGAVNDGQYTALHLASQNGHTDIAKLLLTRGAKDDTKINNY